MSIPTGFFTDFTKNYYGLDPTSEVTEEAEVSALLWKDFLSKVATETDPYFTIISSQDEEAVRQALISLASEYMSPLTNEALTDIGYLAFELATQRGTALTDLTSKDSLTVKNLLTDLLALHINHTDTFMLTILPSIAEDIAVTNSKNQKLYLDYLKGKLETIHTTEATTALSMSEISNRQIIYTLYDIILTLINLIITNQIVESDAETQLTRKREQYLELMRQMFIYKGKGEYDKLLNKLPFVKPGFSGTNSDFLEGEMFVGSEDWLLTRVSFSTNPNEYILGYGDLTLQNILTSLYNSIAWQTDSTNSASFSLRSTPIAQDKSTITIGEDTVKSLVYRQTRFDISIQKDPTTKAFTVTSKFSTWYRHADRSSTNWLNDWNAGWPNQTYTNQISPTFSTNKMQDHVIAEWASTYYNAYNYAKNLKIVGVNPSDFENWASPYLKGKLGTQDADLWEYEYLAKAIEPKIPWPYTIIKDKGIAGLLMTDYTSSVTNEQLGSLIINSARSIRSEQNKILTTLLDSIRSKMDLISNKKDAQQQVINTAATAKKNTINILQTIIRQLQNLLASIYR